MSQQPSGTVHSVNDQGCVEAPEQYGVAVGSWQSRALAGEDGMAYVLSGSAICNQPRGISIVRSGLPGHAAIASDYLAATFRGGAAGIGGRGIAIAYNNTNWHGDDMTAAAMGGTGSLLIFGYTLPGAEEKLLFKVFPVDGQTVVSGAWYRLDRNLNLAPAPAPDPENLKPCPPSSPDRRVQGMTMNQKLIAWAFGAIVALVALAPLIHELLPANDPTWCAPGTGPGSCYYQRENAAMSRALDRYQEQTGGGHYP